MVREAFKTLLKEWGRSHDLVFVTEYEIITPAKERRLVDGALLHELRLPFGYWEAKDEKDDLDAEIEIKFRRGYPQDNIIFEDSRHAVLIQNRQEVIRCAADDPEKLEKLLKLFFAYERAEISEFRQAVAQFKTDLPAVLEALRQMIQNGYDSDSAFKAGAQAFLKHRAVINDLRKGITYKFNKKLIIESIYRPYNKRRLYFSKQLNEMLYQTPQFYG